MTNNWKLFNSKTYLLAIPICVAIVIGMTYWYSMKLVAIETQVVASPVTSKAENLLVNSAVDFDQTSRSPTPWWNDGVIEGIQYGVDKCLTIEKSPANNSIAAWKQNIDRKSAAPAIRVSALVKADNVAKACIAITFQGKDKSLISQQPVVLIGNKMVNNQVKPLNHKWRVYRGCIQIPEGCQSLIIELQQIGPGKIGFDEIMAFYEVDGSKATDAAEPTEIDSSDKDGLYSAVNMMPADAPYPPSSMKAAQNSIGWANAPVAPTPNSSPLFSTSRDLTAYYSEWNLLTSKIKNVQSRHLATNDSAEKEALKMQLIELTASEYELIRGQREKDLERLESELKSAKERMAKRDENKDKIIERRVDKLLGVPSIYDWNDESITTSPVPNYSGSAGAMVPSSRPFYDTTNVAPGADYGTPIQPNPGMTGYETRSYDLRPAGAFGPGSVPPNAGTNWRTQA